MAYKWLGLLEEALDVLTVWPSQRVFQYTLRQLRPRCQLEPISATLQISDSLIILRHDRTILRLIHQYRLLLQVYLQVDPHGFQLEERQGRWDALSLFHALILSQMKRCFISPDQHLSFTF